VVFLIAECIAERPGNQPVHNELRSDFVGRQRSWRQRHPGDDLSLSRGGFRRARHCYQRGIRLQKRQSIDLSWG
jgi:hypothetical protein